MLYWDMDDLNQLLDACGRIKIHLTKYPSEPVTFDKDIRAEWKSSCRACNKAIGHVRGNQSALRGEYEIRVSMVEYLTSLISYTGPYVDTYGVFTYSDVMSEAVRKLAQELHFSGPKYRALVADGLTEDNINRLADFEKLITASLTQRPSLRLRFKLKYAHMTYG